MPTTPWVGGQPQPQSSSQQQPNHLIAQGIMPARTPQQQQQQPQQQPSAPFTTPFSFANSDLADRTAGPAPGTAVLPQGASAANPAIPFRTPNEWTKSRFESIFSIYCSKVNLKLEPQLLKIENTQVDFWTLFEAVGREGGVLEVSHLLSLASFLSNSCIGR